MFDAVTGTQAQVQLAFNRRIRHLQTVLLRQRAHNRLGTWVCFMMQQAFSKCCRVLPRPRFRAIVPQTLRDPIPTRQSNTLLIGDKKGFAETHSHASRLLKRLYTLPASKIKQTHLVHVPSARVTDFVPRGHLPSTLDRPDLSSRHTQNKH